MWPCFKYYLKGWLPTDKDACIVDLGCGDGRVLPLLKEKMGYGHVCGVDISSSQVKLARQHTPNVELGDVIEFLRTTPKYFDLILAFDLIEHLSKNEVLEFIERCYSKLNKGGRIVIQTPNAASPFFGTVRYGDYTHELAFTSNVLSQLLRRAGFSSIESRETGPVPYGYSVLSTIRYAIWQVLRLGICFWSTIETGGCGDKIFTRVFIQSGVKND